MERISLMIIIETLIEFVLTILVYEINIFVRTGGEVLACMKDLDDCTAVDLADTSDIRDLLLEYSMVQTMQSDVTIDASV
jgi:hypothetical protein